MASDEAQRLDRWLWCARIFKSRSLAAEAVSGRGARITRHGQTQLTEKPSFAIRVGDVLSLSRGTRVFILEIAALADRRGPAPEAQTLYIDHSPPPVPREYSPAVAPREVGAGRPTKKERRALDALKGEPDDYAG